jgi:hypothetical protein
MQLLNKLPALSDVLFLTEFKRGYSNTVMRFQRAIFLENESKQSIVLVIHVMRCMKNTLQQSVWLEIIQLFMGYKMTYSVSSYLLTRATENR